MPLAHIAVLHIETSVTVDLGVAQSQNVAILGPNDLAKVLIKSRSEIRSVDSLITANRVHVVADLFAKIRKPLLISDRSIRDTPGKNRVNIWASAVV